MKIVRRYLFTCFFGGFALLTFLGWWCSTRQWTAWDAETPYGIFKLRSESSIFGFGAQFMKHDHPWAAYSNSDPVTGDSMKLVAQLPSVSAGGGLYFLILPYWELMLILLGFGMICFTWERRKIARYKAGGEIETES